MLADICQMGISVRPTLIITTTGAVIGKMVSPIQIGLLGNMINSDENQSGETARSVNMLANC